MGTPASPAQSRSKVHPAAGVHFLLNQSVLSRLCSGRLYPEEVSAEVLKVLLATAARHAGRRISKAVISVRPAHAQHAMTIAAMVACVASCPAAHDGGRLAGASLL